MTTLLQEFEEWLRSRESGWDQEYDRAIAAGLAKLEELKKKYNVV